MSKSSPSLIEEMRARARPAVSLYRTAACHLHAYATRGTPTASAKTLFSGDTVTEIVLRAATTQATLATSSWAGALGHAAVDDSIMAIATTSAAAGLIQKGMKISFGGAASVKVPGRLLDANDAGSWLLEGQPIRVRNQRITAGPSLTPHKLMIITSFTQEMTQSSNIEAVSRALIAESTGLALDLAMFGSAPVTNAPASIIAGVTPITGVAGGGLVALEGDMKALMAALVAANGGANPVLIMSPQQATALSLLASPRFDIPVLRSTSVPTGTVIMVEASSFVSAFGAVPDFEVGNQMALHFEDTAPSDPIMAGTPVKSTWTSELIALRMRLWASWAMRATGHAQVVTGATW
jgi:hypothetical protein